MSGIFRAIAEALGIVKKRQADANTPAMKRRRQRERGAARLDEIERAVSEEDETKVIEDLSE